MTDFGIYVLTLMVTIAAVSIGLFVRWERSSMEWSRQPGLDRQGIERYSPQNDETTVPQTSERLDPDSDSISRGDRFQVP